MSLARAIDTHGLQTAVLHVGYGQRTSARDITEHYGLETWRNIDLTWLRDMGGSSLTDLSLPVPDATEGYTGGCGETEAVPSTYVPFRNATLLAAAVAWAEVLGASEVYCGAHAADSAYPDTQPAFFSAFSEVTDRGTADNTHIEICTPLLHMDKTAIVHLGLQLQAPLHLTWSCYEHQDHPCQRCHSCHLRAQGFAAAGVLDPLMT